MSELGFWPRFVLAVLVTWRVTHLLAYEDGPAHVIAHCRARLGQGWLGRLMDCFNCLSFWVAAPAAFFVCVALLDRLFAWLALSGAACLLERSQEQPVVIQSLADQKGNTDVMLRPEPERDEECAGSGTANHSARRSRQF